MPRFGVVPREVPVERSLEVVAPAVRHAVERVLRRMVHAGHSPRVFETLRTQERQAFLYGFGRDYDDGRGTVTKVADADRGWHFYGLAVDIVENDATPWDASQAFWRCLGESAEAEGMTWGGRWKFVDLPHIQWGRCRISPTQAARDLYASGGREAVWAAVGAL